MSGRVEKGETRSALKKGDLVVVVAGGNQKKRPIKGKTGKIVRFVGENGDRVLVEGVNMVSRIKKATGPNNPGGKIQTEASMHVSNVMYYVEKLKKGVRLKHKIEGGKKVRGYVDPTTKNFVQIEG